MANKKQRFIDLAVKVMPELINGYGNVNIRMNEIPNMKVFVDKINKLKPRGTTLEWGLQKSVGNKDIYQICCYLSVDRFFHDVLTNEVYFQYKNCSINKYWRLATPVIPTKMWVTGSQHLVPCPIQILRPYRDHLHDNIRNLAGLVNTFPLFGYK